jgi:hypothetical protein
MQKHRKCGCVYISAYVPIFYVHSAACTITSGCVFIDTNTVAVRKEPPHLVTGA